MGKKSIPQGRSFFLWGFYVKIDYSTQFYKWEAIIPFLRKNIIRHFVKRSRVQGVHNRV